MGGVPRLQLALSLRPLVLGPESCRCAMRVSAAQRWMSLNAAPCCACSCCSSSRLRHALTAPVSAQGGRREGGGNAGVDCCADWA